MSPGPDAAKPVYPPTYALLALVLVLCLHFLAPVKQIIFAPYRYLGVILFAAGVTIVLWGKGIFRRAGTTIKPFEESSALVVEGPYRVSRNPIYLGMACGVLGASVMAGSLTSFLVAPAFVYLIDRRFVRVEEAMLEQRFGPQYAAYKARVRRWI
ncbi:MAG TPA: isoprenylcysteine carboxylmethyltransferase family protein [Candidatus Polarisedimenticolia bacterium]|nr:isoprenylcysteine carboxylmethyltransferase family protein [Candidatus Polarisedimenticolia bacterium]